MTVTDLLQAIQAEVDGREVVDFYRTLNQEMRGLARKRPWRAYQSEYEFDTTETYSTGTVSVTDGSTTVEGSGTTWTSAMEGRKLRVAGYEMAFEIDSVTDGDTLELTSAWPYDDESDKTYSIYEDEYDLPSDFERLFGVRDIKNNVELRAITSQSAHGGRYALRSITPTTACEYSLWQGDTLRLHNAPVTGGRISVYYYRKPTAVTGPNDTLDVPAYLEDVLDMRLRQVYLLRFAMDNESYVRRAQVLAAEIREAFKVAAALDSAQSPLLIRNDRTNF